MPVFEYKGLDRKGRNVKNTIDADNARAARAKLKKDGIFVSDLKDRTKSVRKVKGKKANSTTAVGVEDLALMTRQLATLLKANVPLVDSLTAVADQIENAEFSSVISEIKNAVNEGAALNKTMAKYPRIFNNIYVSMVEAGELSGTLDIILIRLAEFTESQNELANKVKSAMLYPIIIAVVTAGVMMIMFIFVVPKVMSIFESSPDITLPWYSVMVFDLSGIITQYWYVLIVATIGFYAIFLSWKRTPSGSAQWDAIVLKLPVIGKLSRTIAVSRFSRTLSTLLTGGVPMLTAMNIVRNVVNNAVLASAIDLARDNISEGESIAGPLKKSGQFPPMIIHMINIGEKTGELESMLNQVSDSYDFQVKNEVEGLTSIMEPAMIIFMACVIGTVVFSIMIPMFDMLDFAG